MSLRLKIIFHFSLTSGPLLLRFKTVPNPFPIFGQERDLTEIIGFIRTRRHRENTLRPSGFAFEKPWGDNRLRTCAIIKQKTAIWGRFWGKIGYFG